MDLFEEDPNKYTMNGPDLIFGRITDTQFICRICSETAGYPSKICLSDIHPIPSIFYYT